MFSAASRLVTNCLKEHISTQLDIKQGVIRKNPPKAAFSDGSDIKQNRVIHSAVRCVGSVRILI